MGWWTDAIERTRSLLGRRREARELAEEMRFHIEQEIRKNEAAGMSRREARRAAHLAFGGVDRWTDEWREARGVAPLERLARDLRQGVRRLLREPALTFPALVTLALGIGATTAVFALVHSVLLSPLPFPDSGRLVAVGHAGPALGADVAGQSQGTYAHYRASSTLLEELAAYHENAFGVSATDGDVPERLRVAMVTPSFFSVLGVSPRIGRAFAEEEGVWEPGEPRTPVIISHDLWVRRYGADPEVLNRTIELNQRTRRVVGVLPEGFDFPHPDTDVWYALDERAERGDLGDLHRSAIGRLSAGASVREAEGELTALAQGLAGVYPDVTRDQLRDLRAVVTPLRRAMVADVARPILLLGMMALFVLAVTLANVSGLFLVRAERRRNELAVARALGASRWDLIRRFLAEGAFLALVGGLLGATLAAVAVDLRFGLEPTDIPRLHELGFGWVEATFAGAVAAVSGVTTAGLSWLRSAAFGAPNRATASRSLGGRKWTRVHGTLAAVQVALSLTLLVGSATLFRSLERLLSVDPGFVAENALTFHLQTPISGYPDYTSSARLYRDVSARLSALPGVVGVEATSRLPLSDAPEVSRERVVPVGMPLAGEPEPASIALVTPDYFALLGIPILDGSAFGELRSASPSPPVVLSAGLARDLFGRTDVVGSTVEVPGFPDRFGAYTVAGVVGDVPGERLTDAFERTLYVPVVLEAGVDPSVTGGYPFVPTELTLVVRLEEGAGPILPAARDIVRSLDPKLPITGVSTLEARLRAATARMRLVSLLSALAAVSALLLGVTGVYGIVAYSVTQRTAEIGLRMALGSTSPQVERLVLGRTARIAALGIAGGLVTAFACAGILRGYLYDLDPVDPVSYGGSALIVAVIVLGAGWLPARHAGRLDVVKALHGP